MTAPTLALLPTGPEEPFPEDPPPPLHRHRWAPRLQALIDNPGTWHRVFTGTADQARSTYKYVARERPCHQDQIFEWCTRKIDDAHTGLWGVCRGPKALP